MKKNYAKRIYKEGEEGIDKMSEENIKNDPRVANLNKIKSDLKKYVQ